jgi:glycosyltransferase involved in cell wall biosynthesis
MKKLIIFHLAPFPYISGGIDTWLFNFIKENNYNYNITIFCPNTTDKREAIFDISTFDNLEIQYISTFNNYFQMLLWSFEMYKTSRNFIKKDISPILVLSTIPTMIPIWLLKNITRIKNPIICSVRGQIAQDAIDLNKNFLFKWMTYFLEKRLLLLSNKIVSNGWDTQKYLTKFYNIHSIVIPNAFNKIGITKYFEDIDLETVNNLKKNGKRIILHVGTLRPVKGIEYILEALKIINKHSNNDYTIFIGKGHIDKYKYFSSQNNIKAHFFGEKNNVNDYFKLADVVINVSGGSGISNSLLESLSLGKTTVCWDTYTFSQIIVDKSNGYLAKYKNLESLAEVIKNALDNNLDEIIIKNSIINFNWSHVNNQWLDLIEKERLC